MSSCLKNWNFMRVLRFALGIFIVVRGVQDGVWLFVALGGIFSVAALLNAGCCAAGNCTVPGPGKSSGKPEDVKFEEIK